MKLPPQDRSVLRCPILPRLAKPTDTRTDTKIGWYLLRLAPRRRESPAIWLDNVLWPRLGSLHHWPNWVVTIHNHRPRKGLTQVTHAVKDYLPQTGVMVNRSGQPGIGS